MSGTLGAPTKALNNSASSQAFGSSRRMNKTGSPTMRKKTGNEDVISSSQETRRR